MSRETLIERRAVAAGPLAPLAKSLADDLEPLLSRVLYFPEQKALLSREGGQCPRDSSLLEFAPFAPHDHRCPTCGTTYRGELHDRFWIYWYQLWLAERAVHCALLGEVRDERFADLAARILDGYADRYEQYPNVDNVLGPTRLFFSTYLESIWLLQICIATDLLDRRAPALASRVRDRIIAPSRAIIAEYDEGGSNRQVWNDAALLAAARLLDDQPSAEHAVHGPSGVASHLSDGLLADGTWYEGENYHLFAHRGLWYGVTMAEHAGIELAPVLVDRFQRGFATPFATALPDLTLPSRRDSQYAISLRQWRIAEHCELGLARGDDPELLGAVQRMYRDDIPRRDTGRRTSAADVERNAKASALSRADLSWRALLCARPTLPHADATAPRSALLERQGIAVFRRDAGRAYVALDYGHSGGGHGHPDRLNLLLVHDETRWLDDFGTGSYVERSLHWYRSTLAHNAPLFDGHSQRSVHGELLAYDERGGVGWIMATARGLAAGANAVRTLVVMPDYCIDIVEWNVDRDVTVDLPLHVDLRIDGVVEGTGKRFDGGDGLEDGFAFVRDTSVQTVARRTVVRASAEKDARRLDSWARSSADCEWWRAVAPGPPGQGDHAFRVLRARGAVGVHEFLWSWNRAVTAAEFGETIRVGLADGSVDEHHKTPSGWRVELTASGARSSVDLSGLVKPISDRAPFDQPEPTQSIRLTRVGGSKRFVLGENHYRRSEQSWRDAAQPTATVTLSADSDSLHIVIDVPRSDLTFAPASAQNPYDNEPADINGDSVQLYLRGAHDRRAVMLVPEIGGDSVRARPIDGWSRLEDITSRWERVGDGYRLSTHVTRPTAPLEIEVIVNEMPRGRERRRGQLILGGAHGEFVYLRGDRHDAGRLVPLEIIDD